MTQLRTDLYAIPAALLGPENALPVFRSPDIDIDIAVDSSVPADDRRRLGWRAGYRVLPYRMQDGFDRNKRSRTFRSVILENEFLCVTVLPELGGRVVSLVDKTTRRELLFRNPVFQPANLGLRGAWVSGGIEWNASGPGHSYLTCSPVYAAQVMGTRGEPVVRIYEWDRVKCIAWQVDLHLPPGSPFLFAKVRIVNPHDSTVPVYWWTNIAVPEAEGRRTLAPADDVLYHAEQKRLALGRMPLVSKTDVTYSTNNECSQEFFFRIPDKRRTWIAHLDETGIGIVHASNRMLRGRKMFVWGTCQGSRRWQEYLSEPGQVYLELQGGLARTQMECVPMPPNAQWSWTEAIGLLEADPKKVHSDNWGDAWRAAEAALDAHLAESKLDAFDKDFNTVSTRPPHEILTRGSGWGALERHLISFQRRFDRIPPELVFDEFGLGPDQEPWFDLLENGALPEVDPEYGPGRFMIQSEWRVLLEQSLKSSAGDHWLSWYHLGNMRMEALDGDGAREAWETSLARRRTGWALRNLAVLAKREGRREKACDLLREAWDTGPKIAPLAIEYAQALDELGRYEDLMQFVNVLPADIRERDRIRLLAARAAIRTWRLDEAEPVFDREFANMAEGETTLTDLWFEFQECKLSTTRGVPIDDRLRREVRSDFPTPAAIDFRGAQP